MLKTIDWAGFSLIMIVFSTIQEGIEVSGEKGLTQQQIQKAPASNILGAFILTQIVVLVFLQGGFRNLVICLCGFLSCIVLIPATIKKRKQFKKVSVISFLFVGFAALYLISALFNGLSLTTVSETGAWFAVAAISILSSYQCKEAKIRSTDWLCWFGLLCSALAIMQFSFIESADNGRLQFTFQYANTAGIWFGVIAFLALLSEQKTLRRFAPLPLCSLLLTQSGGAILSFFLVAIALSIYWWRKAESSRIVSVAGQVFLAIFLFGGMLLIPSPFHMVWFLAGIIICWHSPKAHQFITRVSRKPLAPLFLMILLFFVFVAALFLFHSRTSSAVATLTERFIQIIDASTLLGASPLLGSGPDNWQFLYPYYQSAQYQATIVHCSYMQIAVDAGILGLFCFSAIVAVGLYSLYKHGNLRALFAVVLIAVHSLVDFDLAFGVIAFLLAFLLSDSDGPELPFSKLWLGLLASFFGIFACLAGLFSDLVRTEIPMANEQGNYSTAVMLFEKNPLALDDKYAQTEYYAALYGLQEYNKIEYFYIEHGITSDKQALYISLALYQLDQDESAATVLIEELEREPYNFVFFQTVKQVFDENGVPDTLVNRYNNAVVTANTCATSGNALLLPNQRELDTFIYRGTTAH